MGCANGKGQVKEQKGPSSKQNGNSTKAPADIIVNEPEEREVKKIIAQKQPSNQRQHNVNTDSQTQHEQEEFNAKQQQQQQEQLQQQQQQQQQLQQQQQRQQVPFSESSQHIQKPQNNQRNNNQQKENVDVIRFNESSKEQEHSRSDGMTLHPQKGSNNNNATPSNGITIAATSVSGQADQTIRFGTMNIECEGDIDEGVQVSMINQFDHPKRMFSKGNPEADEIVDNHGENINHSFETQKVTIVPQQTQSYQKTHNQNVLQQQVIPQQQQQQQQYKQNVQDGNNKQNLLNNNNNNEVYVGEIGRKEMIMQLNLDAAAVAVLQDPVQKKPLTYLQLVRKRIDGLCGDRKLQEALDLMNKCEADVVEEMYEQHVSLCLLTNKYQEALALMQKRKEKQELEAKQTYVFTEEQVMDVAICVKNLRVPLDDVKKEIAVIFSEKIISKMTDSAKIQLALLYARMNLPEKAIDILKPISEQNWRAKVVLAHLRGSKDNKQALKDLMQALDLLNADTSGKSNQEQQINVQLIERMIKTTREGSKKITTNQSLNEEDHISVN